ncbi:hypothetical protein [Myroides pelagicus]|uniref:Uncharacterized protein n=1 Tax=Myroides pelagicus TaxID=270914 RepID=A0A7K1GHP0_9FLAO|nr:hypothetical protein [Myroides pelagicus]MTH28408.1 hypothetical protein [Myroides pelagicus]
MAKEVKKQEQGAGAPSLLDNIEVASNNEDVVLLDKVKELEATLSDRDSRIAELQEVVKTQGEEAVRMGDLLESKDVIISNLQNEISSISKVSSKVVESEDQTIVRFLLSPAGRFKLPYNVGQEVALHKEVAAEVVEARYAELV